jgi:hypothetical protein
MAAGGDPSCAVRQHDDPLQRSARRARTVAAARPHARLAVLRSFPHGSRGAGAPAASRNLHAGARQRRVRSSRRRANIREIGNPAELDAAVSDAFPGSTIEITSNDGYFELERRQHGLLRPLKAAELSDGTLRYLLLIAALLSPRPPDLMILNEPETSLHPDLLPPLARLIAQAAQRAQIIVVSHAEPLVSALTNDPQARRIVLEKQLGETLLQPDERPSWTWPTR